MYRYGEPDKPYGFGVYGGLDEVIFCSSFEDEVTYTEVEPTPLGVCTDDDDEET